MAEHVEHEKVVEHDPDLHVMFVPEYLREQVEKHVRQLEEDEADVSGYMGIKLVIHPPAPPRRVQPRRPATRGVAGRHRSDDRHLLSIDLL